MVIFSLYGMFATLNEKFRMVRLPMGVTFRTVEFAELVVVSVVVRHPGIMIKASTMQVKTG